MVKIRKNIVTKGWSGKLGDDIVFRKRGSQTYVSLSPDRPKREPSAKQKAQLDRFRLAIAFAKAQIADPQKKARYEYYADEERSAFNHAVADFLRPPDITSVSLDLYTGTIGDTVVIEALDSYGIETVEVDIVDSGGNLVEQGLAVLDATGTRYVYTATTANATPSGGKVVVAVSDYPGKR